VWDCSRLLSIAPMCFSTIALRFRALLRLDRRGDAAADLNRCASLLQYQQEVSARWELCFVIVHSTVWNCFPKLLWQHPLVASLAHRPYPNPTVWLSSVQSAQRTAASRRAAPSSTHASLPSNATSAQRSRRPSSLSQLDVSPTRSRNSSLAGEG
jgi:hypothetical protein